MRQLRCLAVTISHFSPSGETVKERIAVTHACASATLPHKALDYGYKTCGDDERPGVGAQVVVFGRLPCECQYRFTRAAAIPETPGFVRVSWAGYSREDDSILPGTVAGWTTP